MTVPTSNRLILIGFLPVYFGGMGTLAALAFESYGLMAIKFLMVPAALIGIATITVAKLSLVEDSRS